MSQTKTNAMKTSSSEKDNVIKRGFERLLAIGANELPGERGRRIRMYGGIGAAIVIAALIVWLYILADGYKGNNHFRFDNLGSFVGGISLFLGALGVWVEAHLVTSRNLERQRSADTINSFRVLYGEFWKKDEIEDIRRAIISSKEYTPLEGILAKRNSTQLNELDEAENKTVDKLDQFFSLLARIKSFELSGEIKNIPDDQAKLWGKLLNEAFFINHIASYRQELYWYLWNHWKKELVDTTVLKPNEKMPQPLGWYEIVTTDNAPRARKRPLKEESEWKSHHSGIS